MTIQPGTAHICHKSNWAYQTVSAITHSLKHDTPASLRGTLTSPLILYCIWQSCVLSHATQNLRYLLHPTQVQQVQSALISSLQRTLHCFPAAQITMLEMGIPPLLLRQTEQLISLHFTRTHLILSHLYTLRCQRKASNAHPQHSFENRTETAYHALGLSTSYPRPPTMPMSVVLPKPGNRGKPYITYLKPLHCSMDPTTNSRPPPPANQQHTHGSYPSALHDTRTLHIH